MFALDTDDGALLAFPTTAEAAAHCKGIDVKDGYWLFFAEDGSPLEARFERPGQAGDSSLISGVYFLQRAMSGLWLQERLARVTRVEGCGLSTVAELVETLKVDRAKRAARGAKLGRSPMAELNRTKANPWQLKTPPGTSEYTMHVEEKDGKRVLVCTVGKAVLYYDARCIADLQAMLKAAGGWVELGGADEQKPAKDGTVEGWGRSSNNPVGGWYGLKKGLRGRFGVYVPPLMEELGLCELEHNPKNNRIRAR